MSRVQLNFAAVLDTVIWSMRAGNYLADDASANLLKTIGAASTDAERAALAASLNYGSIGGGGGNTLKSAENIEVYFDTDNTNPTTPYTNWFRVNRGQDALPLAFDNREIFSAAWQSNGNPQCQITFGPRIGNLDEIAQHPAGFYLGSEKTASESFHYYYLGAYPTGVWEIIRSGRLTLSGGILVTAAPAWQIMGGGSIVRGGWQNIQSETQFYVGEAPGDAGPNALLFEYVPANDDWRIRMTDNTKERSLFLTASYPAYWDDPRGNVCIGGVPGQGNRDPQQVVFDSNTYTNCHLLIVTPEISDRRMAFRSYHRANSVPDGTHLNNMHSLLDLATASDTIRLFSVSGQYSGNPTHIAFSVRADRRCSSPAGFFTQPADLAEYFDVPKPAKYYEPGTVMVFTASGELVVPSTSIADTKVVGIISTEPGFGLNNLEDEDPERHERMVPIAMCGTVPTRVSTANGPIEKFDLLVSGPDGAACRAPMSAPLGSIIAKAMEDFPVTEDSIQFGVIKSLVWKG